jgi:hypothetical protein
MQLHTYPPKYSRGSQSWKYNKTFLFFFYHNFFFFSVSYLSAFLSLSLRRSPRFHLPLVRCCVRRCLITISASCFSCFIIISPLLFFLRVCLFGAVSFASNQSPCQPIDDDFVFHDKRITISLMTPAPQRDNSGWPAFKRSKAFWAAITYFKRAYAQLCSSRKKKKKKKERERNSPEPR